MGGTKITYDLIDSVTCFCFIVYIMEIHERYLSMGVT